MTGNGLLQLAFYFVVLTALAVPLGRYMAAVYEGRAGFAQRVLGPLERLLYRVAGVRPDEDMGWKRYAAAVLRLQRRRASCSSTRSSASRACCR